MPKFGRVLKSREQRAAAGVAFWQGWETGPWLQENELKLCDGSHASTLVSGITARPPQSCTFSDEAGERSLLVGSGSKQASLLALTWVLRGKEGFQAACNVGPPSVNVCITYIGKESNWHNGGTARTPLWQPKREHKSQGLPDLTPIPGEATNLHTKKTTH